MVDGGTMNEALKQLARTSLLVGEEGDRAKLSEDVTKAMA